MHNGASNKKIKNICETVLFHADRLAIMTLNTFGSPWMMLGCKL